MCDWIYRLSALVKFVLTTSFRRLGFVATVFYIDKYKRSPLEIDRFPGNPKNDFMVVISYFTDSFNIVFDKWDQFISSCSGNDFKTDTSNLFTLHSAVTAIKVFISASHLCIPLPDSMAPISVSSASTARVSLFLFGRIMPLHRIRDEFKMKWDKMKFRDARFHIFLIFKVELRQF